PPAPSDKDKGGATGAYATPLIEDTQKNQMPAVAWEGLAEADIEQVPLLYETVFAAAGADGTVFGSSKYESKVFFRFASKARLPARLGQHENMAYVAAQDYNVYALDMLSGKVVWRLTGASPVLQKPDVIDDDIYVVSTIDGLSRISRLT